MEKKLIAKKLLALAKSLVAGGGAGIKMQATDVEGELLYTGTVKNGKFKLNERPKEIKKLFIERFDAEGYMDGMDRVNGKKVFQKCYLNRKNKDALEDMINNMIEKTVADYEDGDIEISVYFSTTTASEVLFGGWSRRTLKAGDEIEFPVLVEISTDDGEYDETDDIKMSGLLSQNGAYWYRDVFESDDTAPYDNNVNYR